jgi:DNA-binding MarR family transcriptional regulator
MPNHRPAPLAVTPVEGSEQDLTVQGRLKEGGFYDLLGYQLAQARIFATDIYASTVGKPLGLKRVEMTILQLVKANPDVTPTRLARALAVTTPAVSGLLDRLEERGLLLRRKSASDGRAQHLLLTDTGQALAADALTQLLAEEARAMAHLSPGERLMLLELLRKVSHARRPAPE